MDMLVDKIIEIGLGNVIDHSRDYLLKKDTIYNERAADLESLETAYTSLNLSVADRTAIDAYLSCLQAIMGRSADISYLAGIKDTITILHYLGLICGMDSEQRKRLVFQRKS